MVFVKGCSSYFLLESGSDDAEGGTEQISDFKDLLKIVSENWKIVANFQTKAK